MVEIKSISKKYKDVHALTSLSCVVAEGEFVSFLGPSGSGKTTLLNLIAGIIPPTSGEIYFNELDVTKFSPRERNIGFVFQDYALYPNMSVRKNIEFPLESLKIKKIMRREAVEQVSEIVRITELLEKKPYELSGGEQQRVAIARALVKKPKLLLLDEPFSNLDPRLSAEMRIDIKELQLKLGITTIMVTHNQSEAMELSDKIAILSNGRLMQYGATSDLYNNPTNYFCAQFLGDVKINSVRGYFDNHIFVEMKEGDRAQYEDARGIIMCFRPEDVVVGSSDFNFNVTVLSVFNRGRECIVNAKGDNSEFRFFVSSHDTFFPSVGESLVIGVEKKKVMFFDAILGSRVMVD